MTEEGESVELTIGAVAHGGHCVARTPEGQVVFVRHTLPGERVRAVITEERKGYLRADAVEVLQASPDRVPPPCRWAGPDRCGGCDFQHATPAAQRELKAAVVREQLVRMARLGPDEIPAVRVEEVPPQAGWRTRVQYTVDAAGRPGLLKHRSHEVVPIDECLIAHPAIRAAPILGRAWPNAHAVEAVTGSDGETTVLTHRPGNVVPQPYAGPSTVHERALGRDWTLDPTVFWQVHPAAAQLLAQTVVELLKPRPGERAWDLYGGAGLFAAALAPHLDGTGRITLVESDPLAIGAAQKSLQDLTTVTILQSDVDRALMNPRWRGVDIVVLDPPRTGAGRRVVEGIVARSPRAVAYVACDPAALARDIRTFRDAGWQLPVLRAFDLFPHTHHVECVALLTP